MNEGVALKRAIQKDSRTAKDISVLLNVHENTLLNLYKKEVLGDDYKQRFAEIGISIDKTAKVVEYKGTKDDGHSFKRIPFYAASPNAGLIKRAGGEVVSPEFFISIPHFVDCNVALRVSGDSMSPKYCNGDVVICKLITGKTILWGEPYVIITSDYCTVKYLDHHPSDKKKVMLRSLNSEFKTAEMEAKEIKELYLVRGKN